MTKQSNLKLWRPASDQSESGKVQQPTNHTECASREYAHFLKSESTQDFDKSKDEQYTKVNNLRSSNISSRPIIIKSI
jgi:hypothetical protein